MSSPIAAVHTLPALPIISCRIIKSEPVLDISLEAPFTFCIVVTLHHSHPITFSQWSSPLFCRPLYSDGLAFIDTRTGQRVGRRKMACTWRIGGNDYGFPNEKDKHTWITLYPDEPYTHKATLSPAPSIPTMHMLTLPATKTTKQQQLNLIQWPHVSGFKDGEKYEIGVDEPATIGQWMLGNVDEIMDIRKAGSRPELHTESISIESTQKGTFEMKRPDHDGRLNFH